MSQTHHGILIHVIFSTKGRFPLLAETWQEELYRYIGGTIREHKSDLLASGGIEDHVHLLLRVHPLFAIADTVRHLKANSSRWINRKGFVDCRFEWQRGYGVFSVSQSRVDTVRKYIQTQREHHAEVSFEDEYLAFLRRHGIEFDERYVFDDEVVA
jgi:REP element-mobilizing transposase RayT